LSEWIYAGNNNENLYITCVSVCAARWRRKRTRFGGSGKHSAKGHATTPEMEKNVTLETPRESVQNVMNHGRLCLKTKKNIHKDEYSKKAETEGAHVIVSVKNEIAEGKISRRYCKILNSIHI
jgi:hypothetical protein